jgi:hypothetical protein
MMMTASIKYTRTAGTPASRCRPPAPASSEAKTNPRDDAQWIQPSQQSHGDTGEAVTRRETLEQGVGHSRNLNASRKTGDPTREQQRRRNDPIGVDPPRNARGESSSTSGPQSETPPGTSVEHPETQGETDGQQETEVKPRTGNQGQACTRGDRIALRVDPLCLLQRTLHHPADQRLGYEVEQRVLMTSSTPTADGGRREP